MTDSLLVGLAGGIVTAIFLIGFQIKYRLQSIEGSLKQIVEQQKSG